jgi:hypothetical protein
MNVRQRRLFIVSSENKDKDERVDLDILSLSSQHVAAGMRNVGLGA